MPSKAPAKKKPAVRTAKKSKAQASRLNRIPTLNFSKRARMATFMLLFANIAVVGVLIASAATAGFTYSNESDQVYRINSYRSSNGRASLGRSACLSGIARSWAMQMGQRSKLAHSNDTYSGIYDSSLDYIKQTTAQCGNTWQRLGENVGVGADSGGIFNAFVASPGHRANLVGDFTHTGVGAYRSADGRLWIAQVFAKCPSCGSPYTKTPRSVGEPGSNLRDTMTGGQKLTSGQQIYSKNGSYYLVMQSNGNLVLYRHWGGYVWESRTSNSTNAYAVYQTDGNFAVYRSNAKTCHSNTGGRGGRSLVLLGYGNLVNYTGTGSVLWNSRSSTWYC